MSKQKLVVEDVPAGILRKLTADARRSGASLNDICLQVLCNRYEVGCEPTGGKFSAPPLTRNLLLLVPQAIHQHVREEAALRRGATMRGIVIEALADHYGIKPPNAGRRPRTKGE